MVSMLASAVSRAVCNGGLAVAVVQTCWAQVSPLGQVVPHTGMCDASAAVMLDEETILVADDERNDFFVYATHRSGPPLATISWDEQLGVDPESDKNPEADIEGAARIGRRIYWITSHGRSNDGEWRENRHRFFAMEVSRNGERFAASPVGRPYRDLALQLAAAPELRQFDLDRVVNADDEEEKRLAPKKEGLNIEGLSAMADGRSLLIALRNPRPNDQALLVPLLNPAEVLLEGEQPDFGDPFLLDLQATRRGKKVSLSVRSIEYSPQSGQYLIVGGSHQGKKTFALYSWTGQRDQAPRPLETANEMLRAVANFSPEAIVVHPAQARVQLLSDDGSLKVPVSSPAECAEGEFKKGKCEAKHLLDSSRKTFRSILVPLG